MGMPLTLSQFRCTLRIFGSGRDTRTQVPALVGASRVSHAEFLGVYELFVLVWFSVCFCVLCIKYFYNICIVR